MYEFSPKSVSPIWNCTIAAQATTDPAQSPKKLPPNWVRLPLMLALLKTTKTAFFGQKNPAVSCHPPHQVSFFMCVLCIRFRAFEMQHYVLGGKECPVASFGQKKAPKNRSAQKMSRRKKGERLQYYMRQLNSNFRVFSRVNKASPDNSV